MRAPVSVVIPTLDAASGLPDCLLSLMEGLAAGLIREVVIADGGSSDDTAHIAQETGARWIVCAPSRGGQLRAGVAAATGEWLLILHADCTLAPGWAAVVEGQIVRDRPAYFRLRFDAPGVAPGVFAAWADLRARFFGLPYGDQGLLISRADYEAVGGYPDIPLMEDVVIARALSARLMRLPHVITTSAAKYRRDGWLRRGAHNLSLLTRFLLGADPRDLARRYRGGA